MAGRSTAAAPRGGVAAGGLGGIRRRRLVRELRKRAEWVEQARKVPSVGALVAAERAPRRTLSRSPDRVGAR